VILFVNEKPVDVTPPATVADAVSAFDAELGAALAAGAARATDARGIEIAATDAVGPGSIIRVLASSRRAFAPSRPRARTGHPERSEGSCHPERSEGSCHPERSEGS
jgi:hypothetical protein